MKQFRGNSASLLLLLGIAKILVALYFIWDWPGPLLFIGFIMMAMGISGVNATIREKEIAKDAELVKLFTGAKEQ